MTTSAHDVLRMHAAAWLRDAEHHAADAEQATTLKRAAGLADKIRARSRDVPKFSEREATALTDDIYAFATAGVSIKRGAPDTYAALELMFVRHTTDSLDKDARIALLVSDVHELQRASAKKK